MIGPGDLGRLDLAGTDPVERDLVGVEGVNSGAELSEQAAERRNPCEVHAELEAVVREYSQVVADLVLLLNSLLRDVALRPRVPSGRRGDQIVVARIRLSQVEYGT